VTRLPKLPVLVLPSPEGEAESREFLAAVMTCTPQVWPGCRALARRDTLLMHRSCSCSCTAAQARPSDRVPSMGVQSPSEYEMDV